MNRGAAPDAKAGGEDEARDATEMAEALALAAEVPEAWFAAAAGELPIEAAFPADGSSAQELEEASRLLAPLDLTTRKRIVDRAVDGFLRDAPPPANARDEPPRVRRIGEQRWIARLGPPLAAAAAAASLTLILTRPGALDHGEFAGQVRAAAADRAPGDASAPSVQRGDWFLLECRAAGRSIEVVNVRAARPDAVEGDPQRGLGWTVVAVADDGATLHVAADLQPGAWQVACDAYEPSSGRLARLGPPALVLVE